MLQFIPIPDAPVETGQHRAPVVLSFDVEEHHRIEAAAGLPVDPDLQASYRRRMETVTMWLLEELAGRGIFATFFVVGEVARLCPWLIRSIARSGHEISSHGWDHRRIMTMTPLEFRRDVRDSKDAIEQVIGAPVAGYRAPTFSIVRQTVWALEVLVEEGYVYDSSIYPVRHDRYGMPEVPRTPFVIPTSAGPLREIPPLTLGLWGLNLPVGGGGSFRLLPSWLLRRGIDQMERCEPPAPAMLYFHPWEFDPEQEKLPLKGLSRLRTYSGIAGSRRRLRGLLDRGYRFARAIDVVRALTGPDVELPVVPLLASKPIPAVGRYAPT